MTLAIDKIVAEGALMLVRGDEPHDVNAYVTAAYKTLSDTEKRILAEETLARRNAAGQA